MAAPDKDPRRAGLADAMADAARAARGIGAGDGHADEQADPGGAGGPGGDEHAETPDAEAPDAEAPDAEAQPRRGFLRLKLAILAVCALIPPAAIAGALYQGKRQRVAAERANAIADLRDALARTYQRIADLGEALEQARRVKRPTTPLTSDDVVALIRSGEVGAVEGFQLIMALDAPRPEEVEARRAAEVDEARRQLAALLDAGVDRDDAERGAIAWADARSAASPPGALLALAQAVDLVRVADGLPARN